MEKEIVLFDNKINCCGCWACENICPSGAVSMSEDEHGFLYPEIDASKCVKCGMCLKVCPIKKKDAEAQFEAAKPHIKIVNYGHSDNFGAAIASACLESTVKSIVPDDYIVQTVNYNSSAEQWNKYTRFQQEIANRMEFINLSLEKLKLKKHIDVSENNIVRDNENLRMHRYKKFRNSFINQTVQSDNCALENNMDNDVALICGSDVIWPPSRIKYRSSKGFYLGFGKKSAKRIAFAVSLDAKADRDLKKKRRLYKKKLEKFDYISVRESENVPFVQSATKKEVKKCVDPVFFYRPSDFDKMIMTSEEKNPDEEYIYAYILMHNDSAYQYVLRLAKEKNLKVLYFADFYDDFGENSVDCYADGPAEFIQRLKNAKYVVTTSFHCIVFSLIFKKQFLAFDRGNKSIKIPDILETFGIPERIVRDFEEKNIDDPIDFEKTDKLIEKYREEALGFLKESLK